MLNSITWLFCEPCSTWQKTVADGVPYPKNSVKNNRLKPWKYDKELYKQRPIVECHFRTIKQYRRVFTRFDKLDETYNAFITIAHVRRLIRN